MTVTHSSTRRFWCILALVAIAGMRSVGAGARAPVPHGAKAESKEDEKDKTAKQKAAPKGKVTRIRDALTIDTDLYGVDLSKARLGEAGDLITRDALKGSRRIAIDEGAKVEKEVIKEDQHETRYEEATEEAEAVATVEELERQRERTKHAAEMQKSRPTLLLIGGGVILVALLAIVIALRKMRGFDA